MFKALALLEESDHQNAAAEALRDELGRLDAEVRRLAEAIARGGDLPALLAALQERERRRGHVRAAVADQERRRRPAMKTNDALDRLRAALADWRGTLRAAPQAARTALRALLADRLVFTPGPDGYTFEGPGTVAPIIAGLVPKGCGARTRTIPPALRRALQHRDQGCRFPGCGLRRGEGHHVRHWAEGGPTTLANLALLCRRHHRAVHEEGYRIDRQPDGALRFRRPDGRILPDVPPPPTVSGDPVGTLRQRNEAQGLRLHARTTCPLWLGEKLDLVWAIDVLHPLAARRGIASVIRGT